MHADGNATARGARQQRVSSSVQSKLKSLIRSLASSAETAAGKITRAASDFFECASFAGQNGANSGSTTLPSAQAVNFDFAKIAPQVCDSAMKSARLT